MMTCTVLILPTHVVMTTGSHSHYTQAHAHTQFLNSLWVFCKIQYKGDREQKVKLLRQLSVLMLSVNCRRILDATFLAIVSVDEYIGVIVFFFDDPTLLRDQLTILHCILG